MTVLVTTPLLCRTCGRLLYESGSALVIEGAWDEKRTSRFEAIFASLGESNNKKKKQRHADIIVRFQDFAIYGVLKPIRELRHLEGNLWEIKTQNDRVLFFYREADNKHKKSARLTHMFEKQFGKTAEGRIPSKQLSLARWIESQDKGND